MHARSACMHVFVRTYVWIHICAHFTLTAHACATRTRISVRKQTRSQRLAAWIYLSRCDIYASGSHGNTVPLSAEPFAYINGIPLGKSRRKSYVDPFPFGRSNARRREMRAVLRDSDKLLEWLTQLTISQLWLLPLGLAISDRTTTLSLSFDYDFFAGASIIRESSQGGHHRCKQYRNVNVSLSDSAWGLNGYPVSRAQGYPAVSLTRDVWHYREHGIVGAIESAERANFGRALSLICGGSPLDHEERCLIGSLSDFETSLPRRPNVESPIHGRERLIFLLSPTLQRKLRRRIRERSTWPR